MAKYIYGGIIVPENLYKPCSGAPLVEWSEALDKDLKRLAAKYHCEAFLGIHSGK